MNKMLLVFLLGLVAVGGGIAYTKLKPGLPEKLYVAVEGESKIAVINPADNSVYRIIDLSLVHDGERIEFAPHNVQVSPDGVTVWVTANAGGHGHASNGVPVAYAAGDHEGDGGHMDGMEGMMGDHGHEGVEVDSVIVISAKTDQILSRIPVGEGLHLAHVVLSPDSGRAYATAQTEGAIYEFNALTHTKLKRIAAPAKSEPHGLRISPDGKTAYIAMLGAKSLGILDLAKGELRSVDLGGAPVQAGITPDGKKAFTSLYDTKQLAVFDTATGEIKKVDLPAEAKGPVQMYPTPDSRFVYLADQGFYFGQPESTKIYKIDLGEMKVVQTIEGGRAPHGVVTDKKGERVYVTNLQDETVSVIEVATGKELAKIRVGKEPNGVSFWSAELGGTP